MQNIAVVSRINHAEPLGTDCLCRISRPAVRRIFHDHQNRFCCHCRSFPFNLDTPQASGSPASNGRARRCFCLTGRALYRFLCCFFRLRIGIRLAPRPRTLLLAGGGLRRRNAFTAADDQQRQIVFRRTTIGKIEHCSQHGEKYLVRRRTADCFDRGRQPASLKLFVPGIAAFAPLFLSGRSLA